jgi:asparagine synthase (glutamine-hydrolysing)
LVSDWFGTRHHEELLDAQKAIDILPAVIDQFDEPFADASALPTFLLAQFVRNHVTVALGGDGGDEMFAGYDTFIAGYLANLIQRFPSRWLNRFILPLIQRWSVSDTNMSVGFRLNRFLQDYHHAPVLRNQRWLSAFPPEAQERLLDIQSSDLVSTYSGLSEIIKSTRNLHWLSAVQYAYVATYLQDDILTKVDRASMAHSLEVRSPFLDQQVAALSASIPPRLKMKPTCSKFLLKRAFRNILPAVILNRPKKGFGIPKSKWLKEELKPQMISYFDKKRLKQNGIFSAAFVQRLMSEHVHGARDRQKELWTLLIFEMWRERHQAYL